MSKQSSPAPMREVLASATGGRRLIGRIWRGRVTAERADEYEAYHYPAGVLSIERKPGCLGVRAFRRSADGVTEFTVISYWESMEAMREMHADQGDVRRVAHLDRDPEFLLELPELVEITELYVNDWNEPVAA